MVLNVIVREALRGDIPSILGLIKELAEFEKAPHLVTNTETQLLEDGFGLNPFYKAFVAEVDGKVVAFALSYIRYSTWRGKVIYLEDLYVQPEFRSFGIGHKLMEAKLEYAKSINIKHLMLQVLDWNAPAIRFYKTFQAQLDPEWINVLIEVK